MSCLPIHQDLMYVVRATGSNKSSGERIVKFSHSMGKFLGVQKVQTNAIHNKKLK